MYGERGYCGLLILQHFLSVFSLTKNSIIWPDKLEQTFEILYYLLSLDTKPSRLMNTPIARVVKLSFLDKEKHNNNFIIRYIYSRFIYQYQ